MSSYNEFKNKESRPLTGGDICKALSVGVAAVSTGAGACVVIASWASAAGLQMPVITVAIVVVGVACAVYFGLKDSRYMSSRQRGEARLP
jgi:hypothetical protein